MKVYHYDTPIGDVDLMVDIIGDITHAVNATVMHIKITPVSGTSEDEFLRTYPDFAAVKQLVNSHAGLKALATDNNLNLKVYDQDSTTNVNASTTTTSTTTTSTTSTTTTTTGA